MIIIAMTIAYYINLSIGKFLEVFRGLLMHKPLVLIDIIKAIMRNVMV